MSRKKFHALQTTCGNILEAGTIILHVPGLWAEDGPHQPDHRHYHWVGVIESMEDCDSGILIHCKTAQGRKTAHVRAYLWLSRPSGVQLHDTDCTTTILSRAPQQMEIAA